MKLRRWIPMIVVFLLSGYLFSVGPVASHAYRRALRGEVVTWTDPELIAYYPLKLAAEHSQTVQDVLLWYIGLWLGDIYRGV